jgi:methionine biosynthesis protein MetW
MQKTDKGGKLRLDHRIIASIIKPSSKVLDLGCGEGDLLEYLVKTRDIEGYGIEISEPAIYSCVEKGLSVSHEDIDSGLKDYPDKFFDYVIFNQTMQQVHRPKKAIHRALRIGRQVIVGFPNFCHIHSRHQMSVKGRVPITRSLPYNWYDTPNMHFLGIKDFHDFCRDEKIRIQEIYNLAKNRSIKFFPNLFAFNAIFLITKDQNDNQ